MSTSRCKGPTQGLRFDVVHKARHRMKHSLHCAADVGFAYTDCFHVPNVGKAIEHSPRAHLFEAGVAPYAEAKGCALLHQ
mmetsp:Transcript_39826/g.66057  ORF Transcript_39826/g.66057 Transcript_39826/m.66057 type:complete len:80 (-) Transcript_39826:1295-1534(-)